MNGRSTLVTFEGILDVTQLCLRGRGGLSTRNEAMRRRQDDGSSRSSIRNASDLRKNTGLSDPGMA